MSDALEALRTLRENVRCPGQSIQYGGLRDSEKTRAAIVALMDFASAKLEQAEASTAEPVADVYDCDDDDYLAVRARMNELGQKLPPGAKLYAAPPSTADMEYEKACAAVVGTANGLKVGRANAEREASTAEVRAQALEDFAAKMRSHSQNAQLSAESKTYRNRAAGLALCEAKRIREGG